MKHKKILAVLLTAAMTLGLLTGCGSSAGSTPDTEGSQMDSQGTDTPSGPEDEDDTAKEEGDGGAITFTDMTGREITLTEPATRIVALTPSDCEILYALGAGDTLVGRGEYCDYPAEVTEVPSVQSGADTNIEQIIALEPQVLLMSTMAQTEEQIEQLENAGVHVVVSDAKDIEGVYTAIEMIGTLMAKEEEAETFIADMESTFAELSKKAAGDGTKTIYFEVSPLEYGLWAAGANTFMDEVAEMLGLTNCFADVDGWGEISEEQVLERNPDYIVTITMSYDQELSPEEEIMSRAGWENVTAVKNRAILNLVNNELSRPGPRLAEGAQMLYDFIYGEETEAGDSAANGETAE